MNNNIVLYVNDKAYTGWFDIQLTHSIDSIASGFSLKAINSVYNNEPILPIVTGLPCVITYKGKTVLTGYIDDTTVELNDNSPIRSVNGRSKTADLVDCSIESFSDFKNATLESIISSICKPFGISLTFDVTNAGDCFTEFKIQPGESAFEAMDRACKLRGFLLSSSNGGNVIVSKIGSKTAAGQIIEGENLIDASFSTSNKERFSKYIVKGQDNNNDAIFGKKATGISSTVSDPLITRYRPIVIVAESIVSNATAKRRAEWECSVRRSKSIAINCKVPSWGINNDIWETNASVNFYSKSLGITTNNNYIISNVNRHYNDTDGETTSLTLNPEGSFTPETQEMLNKKSSKDGKNPFDTLKKK